MEGYRFKREQAFAGVLHRFNAIFKPPGRRRCAELPLCINENGCASGRSLVEDVADKATIALICTNRTNANDVAGRADIGPCIKAQRNVRVASRAGTERVMTNSDIVVASAVSKECSFPDSRVAAARGVVKSAR